MDGMVRLGSYPSLLEKGSKEGETPVCDTKDDRTTSVPRVELLGNAAQSRW